MTRMPHLHPYRQCESFVGTVEVGTLCPACCSMPVGRALRVKRLWWQPYVFVKNGHYQNLQLEFLGSVRSACFGSSSWSGTFTMSKWVKYLEVDKSCADSTEKSCMSCSPSLRFAACKRYRIFHKSAQSLRFLSFVVCWLSTCQHFVPHCMGLVDAHCKPRIQVTTETELQNWHALGQTQTSTTQTSHNGLAWD
eukprot:5129634-Amphidinium_carterae.1